MTIEKEQYSVKENVAESTDTHQGTMSQLIVHNDDHNTFDWVIQCLTEVCNHSFEQAEQLSLLIHFKGKARAKTATLRQLRPMKNSLTDRGLSVTIEAL